jgi:hypothetical protein
LILDIAALKERGLIVLECISGSRAYGLATPASDTDIKGVFILPKEEFYGLNYIPQISNETNDIVYYELGRFIELLSVNNPNILELLNTPEDSILHKHPLMDEIKSEDFLSKLCKDTFGKFALSQVKKAKGLNKKILNPIDKERKSVLSFCFVNYEQGAIPLLKFLELKNQKQEQCGLVKIPHMKDVYGLYINEEQRYKGITQSIESNEVSLSSIPKGEKQVGLLYFNKDGYSVYCKEYKAYWEWVEKRNDVRYENTKSHGKNYDAKNMMHTFRLLEMAIEIGKFSQVNVKRNNRDFLLGIKAGNYEYEELLKLADERKLEMENVFEAATLPNSPDLEKINDLLSLLRDKFYTT